MSVSLEKGQEQRCVLKEEQSGLKQKKYATVPSKHCRTSINIDEIAALTTVAVTEWFPLRQPTLSACARFLYGITIVKRSLFVGVYGRGRHTTALITKHHSAPAAVQCIGDMLINSC